MKLRLLSTLLLLFASAIYLAEAWFLPSGTGVLGVQNIPGFGVPAYLGGLVLLGIGVLKGIAILGIAIAWRSNNRFVNNFGQGGYGYNQRVWRNLQQQQQQQQQAAGGYETYNNNNNNEGYDVYNRFRRSAEEMPRDELHSAAFAFALDKEQDKCYQRFICDLATGRMPKTDNEVILSLFEREDNGIANVVGESYSSSSSPKQVFAKAARFGERVRSIKACELRYKCELSGLEMDKLL